VGNAEAGMLASGIVVLTLLAAIGLWQWFKTLIPVAVATRVRNCPRGCVNARPGRFCVQCGAAMVGEIPKTLAEWECYFKEREAERRAIETVIELDFHWPLVSDLPRGNEYQSLVDQGYIPLAFRFLVAKMEAGVKLSVEEQDFWKEYRHSYSKLTA
jgi:hypothetical protein